jgi:hypothetical protein
LSTENIFLYSRVDTVSAMIEQPQLAS